MAEKKTTRLGQNVTDATLAICLALSRELKFGPKLILSAGILSLADQPTREAKLKFVCAAKDAESPNIKDVLQVINGLPAEEKPELRDALFPGVEDEAVAAHKTQDQKRKKGSHTRAKDGQSV